MEEEALSQGMQVASEAVMARTLLEPSEGTSLLALQPSEIHFKLLTSRTVINLCHFKPLNLWQFVIAAIEN